MAVGGMSEALDSFLDYIALEKALSERTVAAYSRDLGQVEEYLRSGDRAVSLEAAGTDDLSEFLNFISQSGCSAGTVSRKRSSMRGFFGFLVREGRRDDDPSALLVSPRGSRKLPHALSVSQVTRLVEAWGDESPLAIRNRALLELAYGAGLRESELTGMTVERLFLEEMYVRPLGKGSKERIVPIGGEAAKWLRLYVDTARSSLCGSGSATALFLTKRGKSLSRMTVWNIVKQAGLRAGLAEKVYPHILRHSFATHLLQGGADLRVVQELLGHSDIRTTEIYTSVDRTYLSEVLLTFHPRASRC